MGSYKVTFLSELDFPFCNMEDYHTTDYSWSLTADVWPAQSSWQLQTPTQTLFGQDNPANAVPEFPTGQTNTIGSRLSLEQFLDSCRREIETLSRVKGLLEEIQRIRGEIELLRPRIDHVEASSYTLQQGTTGCSSGEGLVLVDMVTSTIERIRHDMLRVNDFKLLVNDVTQMKDEMKQLTDLFRQVKLKLDSLESKVNSLESQVSDFSEFVTDMTDWSAEIHQEVTGGRGRRKKSAATGQEDQTE